MSPFECEMYLLFMPSLGDSTTKFHRNFRMIIRRKTMNDNTSEFILIVFTITIMHTTMLISHYMLYIIDFLFETAQIERVFNLFN